MIRIWWILTRALESLKNLHFDWFLVCKVYNAWPKKVQMSCFWWNWRVMQNLKKITDLWFGKWHEEFGEFSPEHSRVSKSGLWWDPFVQSRKCISLKFTETFCVMTMKNHAKFEEELTKLTKLTWGIWGILNRALENLKNLLFNRPLWPKYIIFELKKYRGVMFDSTEDWCKIWRKTDLCFQKWHEEFGKFSFTGWKIAISF